MCGAPYHICNGCKNKIAEESSFDKEEIYICSKCNIAACKECYEDQPLSSMNPIDEYMELRDCVILDIDAGYASVSNKMSTDTFSP